MICLKRKLLICDDLNYSNIYFKSVFDEQPDFEVVGTAKNESEVLRMANSTRPDVILLDIQMDTYVSGISLIKPLKSLLPQCKIIMLTVSNDKNLIFKALENGADNYILKDNDAGTIIEVVRSTCNDMSLLETRVAKKIIEEFADSKNKQASMLYMVKLLSILSKSEIEIVKLFYDGYSRKEISAMRSIEEATLRVQISRILKKTNYTNMKDLIKDIKVSNAFAFLNNM